MRKVRKDVPAGTTADPREKLQSRAEGTELIREHFDVILCSPYHVFHSLVPIE